LHDFPFAGYTCLVSVAESRLVAGRYRLLSPLGQGGMGRVWRARDEVLGREVAIKELAPPPGLTASERTEMQARSRREARAIAQLNQPNVVQIFDVVESGDGDPWIVMEYLPGRSLDEAMQEGTMPSARVAQIGLDLLKALGAAHELGVMHRDVKPGNVLLTDDGRAVLTDFGIATVPGDPYVTRTGLLIGSPAYIAPERAREGKDGPAADLWSLGATLYAATEGKPPFGRPSTIETLAALASDPVPPPRQAGTLAPVIMGLLKKDPADRLDGPAAQRMLSRVLDRDANRATAKAAKTKPAKVPPPAKVSAQPAKPTPAPAQVRREPVKVRPEPVAPRRGTRRKWLWVLVFAMILAAGAIRFYPRDQGSVSVSPSASAPVVTPSATLSPTPPAASSAPPSPPAPPGFVLPAGWQLRDDGTGFKVPVPDGWEFGRDDDGRALWQDRSTGRLILIDQTRQPKPDPVQDWKNNENARRDGYRDYKRLRLEEVPYFDKAADWEFTYTSSGTPVHVLNRGFITAPDQAYSIYWRTPAATWDENRANLQVVLDGFVPARN
jgi:hypothetical protein